MGVGSGVEDGDVVELEGGSSRAKTARMATDIK